MLPLILSGHASFHLFSHNALIFSSRCLAPHLNLMSISSCSPSPHTNLASHNSLEIDTGSFIPDYHPLINRFHFHLWVQWQKKKRCLSPCRIPRDTCLKKTPVARTPKRHGSCSHEAGDWGPKLDISILLLMLSKDSIHWKTVVSCQCPSSFSFDQFLYSMGVKHLKGKKRIPQNIWQERIVCVPTEKTNGLPPASHTLAAAVISAAWWIRDNTSPD